MPVVVVTQVYVSTSAIFQDSFQRCPSYFNFLPSILSTSHDFGLVKTLAKSTSRVPGPMYLIGHLSDIT